MFGLYDIMTFCQALFAALTVAAPATGDQAMKLIVPMIALIIVAVVLVVIVIVMANKDKKKKGGKGFKDFDDNTLTIEINQENEKDNSDKSYIRKERSSFSMSRSYYLENGTEEGIKAKLDNGVLNIVIPKTNKPAQNKKLISIE